jgi:hypothetical protein
MGDITAESGAEFFPDDDPGNFKQVFGPAQVDEHISLAIQTCWMFLPEEKRNVDEVETQMRRIFERAIRDMREDDAAFSEESG